MNAAEFVTVGDDDRRYTARRRVRLGDVRPDGSVRLDALARYAQDVATDDAADSGLTDETGFWVLRRVVGEISGPVGLGELVDLTTFCGGSGPRWAERRTQIVAAGGATVELSAVWVHVDRATGAPLPVPAGFHATYGAGTRRRIRARLEHPAPLPGRGARRPWASRATDFDVLGHVNNAVYWAPVEDELVTRGITGVRRIELEHRAGIEPGEPVELVVDGEDVIRVWFTVGGDVRASAAVWPT